METNKIGSRKFIVWLTASAFFAGAIAYGFITKDDKMALDLIPWWGGISVAYIGGNVAQKFVPTTDEKEEE